MNAKYNFLYFWIFVFFIFLVKYQVHANFNQRWLSRNSQKNVGRVIISEQWKNDYLIGNSCLVFVFYFLSSDDELMSADGSEWQMQTTICCWVLVLKLLLSMVDVVRVGHWTYWILSTEYTCTLDNTAILIPVLIERKKWMTWSYRDTVTCKRVGPGGVVLAKLCLSSGCLQSHAWSWGIPYR